MDQLSRRELEIVMNLAEGLTTKQIADKLYLSHHTVDTHRRNILRKVSVKNTFQLVYQLRESINQLRLSGVAV